MVKNFIVFVSSKWKALKKAITQLDTHRENFLVIYYIPDINFIHCACILHYSNHLANENISKIPLFQLIIVTCINDVLSISNGVLYIRMSDLGPNTCIVFKYNYKYYKIFKYKYNCNYFGQDSN